MSTRCPRRAEPPRRRRARAGTRRAPVIALRGAPAGRTVVYCPARRTPPVLRPGGAARRRAGRHRIGGGGGAWRWAVPRALRGLPGSGLTTGCPRRSSALRMPGLHSRSAPSGAQALPRLPSPLCPVFSAAFPLRAFPPYLQVPFRRSLLLRGSSAVLPGEIALSTGPRPELIRRAGGRGGPGRWAGCVTRWC